MHMAFVISNGCVPTINKAILGMNDYIKAS